MPTSWLGLLRWTLSHPRSPLCSGVRSRLPLSVVPRQLPLSAPFSNQLSSGVPLPLPDTARSEVQKPFVWFRAKTDKGIICLAGHPYSVTAGNYNVQVWVIVGEKRVRRQDFFFILTNTSWHLGVHSQSLSFFRSSFKRARKLCLLGINTW